MSKIGKKLIKIPQNVQVTIDTENLVIVKGPLGELKYQAPKSIVLKKENDTIELSMKDKDNRDNAKFWGLARSLVANMVVGVSTGYVKELEVVGIGYKVAQKGNDLEFAVGYSHPVIYKIPQGVKISVAKEFVKIEGIDKQLVGQVAAEIKAIKKPDAYKGKGIRYKDEVISLKQGKKAIGEGK